MINMRRELSKNKFTRNSVVLIFSFCVVYYFYYLVTKDYSEQVIWLAACLIIIIVAAALIAKSYELAYFINRNIASQSKLKSMLYAIPVVVICFILSIPCMYIIKVLMDNFYPF